jgi:hypothetical protein
MRTLWEGTLTPEGEDPEGLGNIPEVNPEGGIEEGD